MKKILFTLSIILGLSLTFTPPVKAGEVDVLLDILVKKGVLTSTEARIVRDETKKVVAAEKAYAKSNPVPKWVENTKLKGDLRLRYQWNDKKGSTQRHRGRYRFRLGLESKVSDKFKVAAGLATGGDDPRSTNQTFTDTFETPDIRTDYAFVKYSPLSSLDIYGGKMKRKPVLWAPSDLLWDGDINPEGGSISFNHDLDENINLFFNNGVWVLDESSSDTSDPFLVYVQPGLNIKFDNGISWKTALTFYDFENVEGSTLDQSAGTNSLDGTGKLTSSYKSINPATQISFKEPFDGLVDYASLFGEFVTNLDDENVSETEGWLAGFAFGDKKVSKPKQWQFKYMYRHLEKDAFLDTFPDSDAFSGETDTKGHEWIFKYALSENVVLGIDYYRTNKIKGGDTPEHLLQTDLVLKF